MYLEFDQFAHCLKELFELVRLVGHAKRGNRSFLYSWLELRCNKIIVQSPYVSCPRLAPAPVYGSVPRTEMAAKIRTRSLTCIVIFNQYCKQL